MVSVFGGEQSQTHLEGLQDGVEVDEDNLSDFVFPSRIHKEQHVGNS